MSTNTTPLSLRKVSASPASSSLRKASTSTASSSPTSAVPPSYRESLLASYPYGYCNHICKSPISNSYLNPRIAPPIPLKSPARPYPHPDSNLADPIHDLADLEACIRRVEAHHTVGVKASELYRSTNTARKHAVPRISKRVVVLLALNACAITNIAVAGYMGTTSRKTTRSSVFYCNFTNALPKALISAAFVFVIAVVGLTPYAQRMLSGRFWTQLLYVFFLFQLGGIVGALNNRINITIVKCPAGD